MMRDNRIMRTDRPGGNIRLFLCKMKKKKKEVENMKSKYRFRRILSGVMAAVTILSTVISPLTVYASEEPKAAEPPAYESVKDQLDENEVVKTTDLELEVGQDFDVSTDFTNLEIKDESKVKVTFQKAENDASLWIVRSVTSASPGLATMLWERGGKVSCSTMATPMPNGRMISVKRSVKTVVFLIFVRLITIIIHRK